MKKQVSFTIDIETLQKLAKLADGLDMTRSKIVNDLLIVLLKETDNNKIENILKKTIENLKS